jgi:hypothetical protein
MDKHDLQWMFSSPDSQLGPFIIAVVVTLLAFTIALAIRLPG